VNNTSFRFTVPPGYEEVIDQSLIISLDPNSSAYSISSFVKSILYYELSGGSLSFYTAEKDSAINYDVPFFEFFSISCNTSNLQFESFVTATNDTFMIAQAIESTFFPDLQYSIAMTTFDSVSAFVLFTDATSTTKKEHVDDSFFQAILKSFQVYKTERKSTFLREEDYIERKRHN